MTKEVKIPNQQKWALDSRIKKKNEDILFLKAQVTAYRQLVDRYHKNENNNVAFDVWEVCDKTAANNVKEFSELYDLTLEQKLSQNG